ncbi:MAG: MtrB/PioB family decaheme-associated outer membrane protein [Betaproteobacteria bacterium]|nr:MtrB/PioB family decaheme-associated outer membrane protein [Betaproteobacteria bacterium]
MNRHTHAVPLTAIAAALLAVFGPALAADAEEIARLTKPESTIEFGIGHADRDGRRFGQYSGLNEKGAYGLLSGTLIQRDDAGTWFILSGRNLGLESRELRLEHNRQGNWGYFIEYGEITRFDPYTINTGLTGIGTPIQTINGTGLRNVDLKVKREAVTLGASKYLPAGWDVQVRYKNEEKDGARLWGEGGAPTNFLTDPINQTTRQLEVILGYTGEKLQLSGGYYGAFFDNHNSFLTSNSTLFAGFPQRALPPGNQSHQLHLSGGYTFSPTTRGNFKVAYAKASQTDGFFITPTNNSRGDLGGRVDTTLVQMGIVARPLPKLSLTGNVRYEDKNDKTPLAFYTVVAGGSTLDGFNEPRSIRTLAGKLEASYALPMSFRLSGGIEYDQKKRNTFRVASVTQRQETEEISYSVGIRRSMSDSVTGGLSYIHSDRDGSPFLTTIVNSGATGSNLIAPIHLSDRKRDKVRLSVNWQATEQLSLQFRADESRDNYGQRDGSILGAQKGQASAYSVDAAYTFSDKWQGTAWISRDDTRFEQLTRTTPWQASLRNVGDSFGLGLRGKPYSWLEAGGDLSYSNITDENRQQALAGAATSVIPDFTTKLTKLNLFAKYAVEKNTSIRVNYVYDRFDTNDWTWTTWTYTDGTRVLQNPVQKVHFIGISVYHRWQ